MIRFHTGKISSTALAWSCAIWHVYKLEKGVNAKVIEFADNTKLFGIEKIIWFRELQEKVMKQSES